jgi:hypothetical protein
MSSSELNRWSGHGFNRERARNPHAALVDIGLIVERFLIRVASNRDRVNLLPCHALANLRIVGDGFQRDVRHALVAKSAPDPLFRMGEFVVIEVRRPSDVALASVVATREVSHVIQRRPHCSAT